MIHHHAYSYFWETPLFIYINKIQQDATDAGIYLLQNYSTCFECLSHQSTGVHQTATAASGTVHIIRQRPSASVANLMNATLAEGRCPDTMTSTRRCSYILMYS